MTSPAVTTTRCCVVAFMPQWDFLDFIAAERRWLPKLKLMMRARVDALIEEGGRVAGVRGSGDDGPFEVRAALTVGCDGRHSTVREAAPLPLDDVGAPIDVMWFRVGRDGAGFDDTLARITPGRMIVTIDRGDCWQCAFVIAKGRAEALRGRGIDSFRSEVAKAAPVLAPHVGDIVSWDDVKPLTVSVDRLMQWSRAGLLCIGDAAHAMSPVGGVGINLAILTRVTQATQVQVQNNVLVPAISSANAELEPPLPMRLLAAVPPLQRLFARVIGMGVRPEHVRSPLAP